MWRLWEQVKIYRGVYSIMSIPRDPSLDHIPLNSFLGADVVHRREINKVGVVSDVKRESDRLRFFTDTGIEFIVARPNIRSNRWYSSRDAEDSGYHYVDIRTLNRGICYTCIYECMISVKECAFYEEKTK